MNLAPPVYQFLSSATGGAKDGQLEIHALPGIRTQDLCAAADFPSHYAAWPVNIKMTNSALYYGNMNKLQTTHNTLKLQRWLFVKYKYFVGSIFYSCQGHTLVKNKMTKDWGGREGGKKSSIKK